MLQWLSSLLKRSNDVAPPIWENFTVTILNEIYDHRNPLTITSKDSDQTYTTIILKVDETKGLLTFDELFPHESSDTFEPGKTIQVQCKNRGIKITFDCIITKLTQSHGVNGLVAQFPDSLEYQQRRDSFRVIPPENIKLKSRFRVPNQPSFQATVDDLSLTGMRLTVPQNIVQHLKPNMLIEHSEIVLSTKKSVSCSFKICHLAYKPDQRGTVLGCEFNDLNSNDRLSINRAVTDFQRIVRDKSD